MTLADRIAERLTALDLSEGEACRRAGLAHTYIRDIRKGNKRSPRSDTLERLAEVLETSREWLLTGGPADPSSDADLQKVINIWDHIPAASRKTISDLARQMANKKE